jgi:hypothetical protein
MTVVLLIKTESLVVQGKLWGLDNDMECQLRKHKKLLSPLSSRLSPLSSFPSMWSSLEYLIMFLHLFSFSFCGFFYLVSFKFRPLFQFLHLLDVFYSVVMCLHTSVAKFRLVLGKVTFFQFLCSSLCVCFFFSCPSLDLQWVLWL